MRPGNIDFDLYRGDSYEVRVRLWSDDAGTVAVDLTGATVAAQIRNKTAGTTIVDLGVLVTLPNIVNISMTPDMYATCPAKGVWDMQVTFSDGQVNTPVAGKVAVTGDVTDSLVMPTVGRQGGHRYG